MKIAVTAHGEGPDARFDERFGRCDYFVIYDTASGDFRSVKNTAAAAPNGAGGLAAALVRKEGVSKVFAGEVGPKAAEALRAAGIEWETGGSGTVRDVLGARGVL